MNALAKSIKNISEANIAFRRTNFPFFSLSKVLQIILNTINTRLL